MVSNPFSFGQNMVGQEQWARRGENDARIASLETSRTTDEALLALIQTGAWTAYTPALTQGVAVTNTVTYAKYHRSGRMIVAQAVLAVTGTGTAASTVLIGLPVAAAAPNNALIGTGEVIDASTGLAYRALAKISGSNCFLIPTDSQVNNTIGSTGFTAALASGDNVCVNLAYESAS